MSPDQIDDFCDKLIAAHGVHKAVAIMKNNLELAKAFEDSPYFDEAARQSWIDVLQHLEVLASLKNDNMTL